MTSSTLKIKASEPRPLQSDVSLRQRMDLTVASIFVITVVVLTVMSAVATRNAVLRGERHHAQTLLDHLSSTLELRRVPAARSEIARLQPYLARLGSRLELVEPGSVTPSGVVVQKSLSGGPNALVLRYTVGSRHIADLTRSIVVTHVMGGGVALAGVLLAVELTLRRRLVVPLLAIKMQLESLCRDGWFVAVPGVDDELAPLQRALGNVGPAVSAHTIEWMRRSTEHEKDAAGRRIRELMESRVPAAIDRIESLTRSGRLSLLSLDEAYAAEEEVLGIAAALVELRELLVSPRQSREGHA